MNQQQSEPALLQRAQPEWMLWLYIGLFVVYLLLRLRYGRYWIRFRHALVYPIEAQNLLKEQNMNLMQMAVALNSLAVLSISLFLFQLVSSLLPDLGLKYTFTTFLLMGVTVALFCILKYLAIALLGRVFNKRETAKQANHLWLVHLKNLGLPLITVTLLAQYTQGWVSTTFLIIGITLPMIAFISNSLRSAALLIKHRVSLFYGILYLCTLEFLPITMIVRTVL